MNTASKNERGSLAVRIIVTLLAAVQGFTVWYLLGTLLFPLVLAIVTGWVALSQQRIELRKSTRFRLCMVLAVVFIIKSRVAPIPVRQGVVTSLTQMAHAAGQFLMVLQLLLLVTSRNRRLLPQIIPWLGAMTMICAGDIYVNEIQRMVFQVMVILFIMLAAAFAAMNREMYGRRRGSARTLALGVFMASVGISGWLSAASLYTHSRDIEDFVQRLVEPRPSRQQAGFTTKGSLQSVVRFRETNADDVAMHVRSILVPGYMRGFVFGEYTQREWVPDRTVRRNIQASVLGNVPSRESENVFFLSTGNEEDIGASYACWPLSEMESAVFLPPDAKCVVAEVQSLASTAEGNITAPELPVGYPYEVYTLQTSEKQPLADSQIRDFAYNDLISAPAAVLDIADQIFHDGDSFEVKTKSVVEYFNSNFEYALDFEAPMGVDPLEWFLTRNQQAHCEYFATAAALVLRAGNIPARYVTGFMVTEQNTVGDYWVVRNKHAHAWVEAYDQQRQRWVVVEATPPDGVPQAESRSRLTQLWDYAKDRYQVLRVRLHQRGVWWAIRALLSNWLVRALLGLLLIWMFIRLRRFNRTFVAPLRKSAAQDPHGRAFQRVLAIADKKVKRRHGLTRAPYETLHQFAHRVSDSFPAASSFYQNYAAARYAPNASAMIGELRQVAKAI